MTKFGDKYGPWALVTGASSGIGEEFARQLAARGLNVVLAARRIDRLDALARELSASHGIQVRTVEVDLAREDGVEVIFRRTADLDVDLVVNNAGIATPGAFVWSDASDVIDAITINVRAPAVLAHHFGKRMARRGSGGVIFVASTFAYQPVPYFQNYAATKAYALSLGQALHVEMRALGVDVTVLSPGPTTTAMKEMDGFDLAKMPMAWMSVRPVVNEALRALGRKPSVIPGVMNRVMAWMGRHLASPDLLARAFGALVRRGVSKNRLALRVESSRVSPAPLTGGA